jgi:hypothetical protein
MAKRLAKETSTDDSYKNIVADFLEALFRHFAIELKAKRYNKDFI